MDNSDLPLSFPTLPSWSGKAKYLSSLLILTKCLFYGWLFSSLWEKMQICQNWRFSRDKCIWVLHLSYFEWGRNQQRPLQSSVSGILAPSTVFSDRYTPRQHCVPFCIYLYIFYSVLPPISNMFNIFSCSCPSEEILFCIHYIAIALSHSVWYW